MGTIHRDGKTNTAPERITGAELYRMGHTIFRRVNRPVAIIAGSIRNGLELHSESGRVTHVPDVRSARTPEGDVLMLNPDGTTIKHPEHGELELPEGVYSVETVREARPEEEKARTIEFETPSRETTTFDDSGSETRGSGIRLGRLLRRSRDRTSIPWEDMD